MRRLRKLAGLPIRLTSDVLYEVVLFLEMGHEILTGITDHNH